MVGGPAYTSAGAVSFPKRKARLWAGRFANIPNVMKREQNRHKRLFTLSPRELNLSDSHGVFRGPPAALSFAPLYSVSFLMETARALGVVIRSAATAGDVAVRRGAARPCLAPDRRPHLIWKPRRWLAVKSCWPRLAATAVADRGRWGIERPPAAHFIQPPFNRNHAGTWPLNQVGRNYGSSEAVGRVGVADKSPPRRPHSLSLINRSINRPFIRNRADIWPLNYAGRD